MLTINEEITLENQQERISALLPQGCRFVTMTAVDSSTHFDIYYHFDRNSMTLEPVRKRELGTKTESKDQLTLYKMMKKS